MKTQQSADVASGIFLFILGLVVVFAAMGIKGGMEERLPPRTLPFVLGWTILAAGVILTTIAWRSRRKDVFIKWPAFVGAIRVLVTLVGLMFYLVLLKPLGLPLSTFLFVSFLVWYLGRYRLVVAILIGLTSASVVYLLFIRLLELSFPMGFLAQ